MTEKLSSTEIKNLIIQWMNVPDVYNIITRKYVMLFDNDLEDEFNKERISEITDYYKCGATKEAVKNAIISSITNPQNWSEVEKYSASESFYSDELFYDTAGYIAEDASLYDIEKCTLREFYIGDDYVADNYRLEVITNPDDNKVIFWNLIED